MFKTMLYVIGCVFLTVKAYGAATISSVTGSSTSTTVTYQYSYAGGPTSFRFLIDSDINDSTGYVYKGIGANYYVQDGYLYRYSGTGGAWGWTQIRAVTASKTSTVYKVTINKSDLGSPSRVDVIGQVSLNGVVTDSSIYRQTLVAPSPTPTPPPTTTISSVTGSSTSTTVTYQYGYTGDPTSLRFLIDSDVNDSTGYSYNGIGANYYVQDGSLYRYSGTGGAWGWTRMRELTHSDSGTLYRITINRSEIGSPSQVDVIGQVSLNGVSTNSSIYRQTLSTSSPTPRPSATPAPTATPPPVGSVPFKTSTCPMYQHVSVNEIVVKNEHPHVFLTKSRLDQLRAQYRSGALANNKYWKGALQTAQVNVNRTDAALATVLSQWSQLEWITMNTILVAAVSENSVYINDAKRMANRIRTAHGASGTIPNPKDTYINLSERTMSLYYDWLYDKLSATERTLARQDVEWRIRNPATTGLIDNPGLGAHDFGAHLGGLIASLAIYNESTIAQNHVETRVLPHILDHYLPSYNYLLGCDGAIQMSGYSRSYADTLLETITSITTATNINMYQRFPNFQNLVYYFAYGTRGDQNIFPEGDAFEYGTDDGLRRLFERVAKGYRNGYAQSMFQQYEQLNGFRETSGWFSLLYGESAPTAIPLSNLPKSKFFKPTGYLFAKSGWQQDSVAPQVSAMFKSTPHHFVNHVHRDMNSFAVYYRGDQLLGNTGSYDAYVSSHWHNYFTRTIAKNSLLVYNPAEIFNLWGADRSNDGGQQIGNPVPDRLGDLQSSAFNYGGIVFAEDTPDYTYGIGRAEKAYSKVSTTGAQSGKKLNYYARHFLFLKNVTGAKHPVIIIYDDLDKTSANYVSKFVLHTASNMSFANRTMVSTNGSGRVQAQFLMPASLSSSIIGGSGREYEVEGDNYPPTQVIGGIPAGRYRLEVRPSAAAASDRFLAVIYAGDPSSDPAPAASLVSTTADSATIRVGNYTIRFVTDDVVVTKN